MLKEEIYEKASKNFGTSVGVAHHISYKNKKEQINEGGIESFKIITIELEINNIICEAIMMDLYQDLQRAIYKIKKTGNKRLKETTIYNRAFKEIIKDENYITKYGEIF